MCQSAATPKKGTIIPNVRKPREYSAIKGSKVAEGIVEAKSMDAALKAVDWTYADHYRFLQAEKTYASMINAALHDRSRQLLERTLEIEHYLSELDSSASSTDVNAARVRVDILKTVAVAYDKSLSPSGTSEDKKEKGLVDLLRELEEKHERVANNTSLGTVSPDDTKTLHQAEQGKLTH